MSGDRIRSRRPGGGGALELLRGWPGRLVVRQVHLHCFERFPAIVGSAHGGYYAVGARRVHVCYCHGLRPFLCGVLLPFILD